MPNWKLIILSACVFISGQGLSCSTSSEVDVDDGHPFRTTRGELLLEYDGSDQLSLRANSQSFSINARPPASLYIAHSKGLIAYNFGYGSGQVYDLEIYSLSSGKYTDLSSWKSNLLKRARSVGCHASLDSISVLFKRWNDDDSYVIRTEDFSRLEGCDSLAGEWQIRIDKL
jgi:hypothetical protein